MSTATLISAETASGAPQINPWLIGVVVSLAAFMEVLDTSIANVALPHIAGSMGASNDESTWVLTSYLIFARYPEASSELRRFGVRSCRSQRRRKEEEQWMNDATAHLSVALVVKDREASTFPA